ncbi:MAG: hypothetical protein WCT77_02890 [Bacteroidota bacterium]|jgi:hypothetical protein
MIPVKRVSKLVKTENTGLVGYVNISYDHLVIAFGKPTSQRPSGDDKVRIIWDIEFEDGTVATIYDWKNYGKSVKWVKENFTEWHIGGNDKYAVDKVLAILKDKRLMFARLPFN